MIRQLVEGLLLVASIVGFGVVVASLGIALGIALAKDAVT